MKVKNKVKANRMDWEKIVESLEKLKTHKKTVQMGSAGSAQVTRIRLLKEYDGLYVRTRDVYIDLSLVPFSS